MKKSLLKLLLQFPFYGKFATQLSPVQSDDPDITIECSDGRSLVYNPLWFQNLSENHKTGVLMHELLHLLLGHSMRRENRAPVLWAIACDITVNSFIPAEYLFDDAITLFRVSKSLGINLPQKQGAEIYYNILDQLDAHDAFGGSKQQAFVYGDSDSILKADILKDFDGNDFDKAGAEARIANCFNQDGDSLPEELRVLSRKVLTKQKINWRNILKRFLGAPGRTQRKKSYKKQSRRFAHYPGSKRERSVRALLAIDESGSIPEDLSSTFLEEIKKIYRITHADLEVCRFDSTVSDPIPLKQFVNQPARLKGGGTDFRPVFEMADKKAFSSLIIFTDGDGQTPDNAKQDTLWILGGVRKQTADFGTYIELTE